jgi:Cu-processing system permease protein
MLSQPIGRRSLFLGIYFGTALPLAAGFVIGILTPFLLFGNIGEQFDGIFTLLLIGTALTLVFTAIAFLVTVLQDDKAKGLGIIILFWLIFAVIYDGLVLVLVYYFSDYPLEKAMIALSIINPIDLGRILFLIKFNISALMGYTGAVFQKFFGRSDGVIISAVCILFWILIPLFFSTRVFRKKDF